MADNDVPEDEVQDVVDSLNRESLAWRNIPQSPLAILVSTLRYGANNFGTYSQLLKLFETEKNFAATPSREMDVFESLQKRCVWMRKDARRVYGGLMMQLIRPTPRQHWTMSVVFHHLYNLPKEFIYSEIVRYWTLNILVVGGWSRWDSAQKQDLIDFLVWCVTRNVARALSTPSNYYARLAVDTWQEMARHNEISATVTLATTMRLMPFNMTAIYPNGTSRSLAQIIMHTIPDATAAHILYPIVFGPTAALPVSSRDVVRSISLAISGGASLAQVEQIHPYTDAPSRAVLMADIVRTAVSVGKINIAEAYGLGSTFLNYLDTSSLYTAHTLPGSIYAEWHIFDVLSDVREQNHVAFLQALGLSPSSIGQLLDDYQEYLYD